jgi:hypothetical protein
MAVRKVLIVGRFLLWVGDALAWCGLGSLAVC